MISKMISAQELENAARGYVTLENFIKVREEELAALYRDSSVVMTKTRRLVVAIARLGQVAVSTFSFSVFVFYASRIRLIEFDPSVTWASIGSFCN